jgi:hypothetical protein
MTWFSTVKRLLAGVSGMVVPNFKILTHCFQEIPVSCMPKSFFSCPEEYCIFRLKKSNLILALFVVQNMQNAIFHNNLNFSKKLIPGVLILIFILVVNYRQSKFVIVPCISALADSRFLSLPDL